MHSVRRVLQIAQWGIVTASSLFVLRLLRPRLLVRDTTPAGGDTGAHVWFPAFLRDHLIGDLRVAGWSMDLFAGFPAGQFYFPLPALAAVVLDVVMPYNVAFKLVTAAGPVLLPIGAAILLAGLRAPRPTPALAAVAATAFLFFKGSPHEADAQTVAFNQRIMGGTLASTLAGEFSFGIALALALCFLGALAWALDARRFLWVPALLGAAVVLSHLIVAIFAVVGALVIWATRRPVRNAGPALAIGAVAGLLTAFWSVPLVATLSYTSDMRYEPITAYVTYLFPGYLAWMLPFVLVAIVVGIVESRRSTLVVGVLTAAMAIVFRFWEGLAPTPVWNLRLLPFWYLGLFLLTAVGAAELVRGLGLLARRAAGVWARDGDTQIAERARVLTMTAMAVVVAIGALAQLHNTRGFLDFWARWNYSGFEETGATSTGKAYPEYRAVLDAMAELPEGRAVWEPSSDLDRYGTPLALTLLPHATDGRIPSLEGVYYESSSTTPYAFLTIAKLAGPGNASNPVRGFQYGTIADFGLGVTQLQALGVRYHLTHSVEAKEVAAEDPRLELVATVPDLDDAPPHGWEIYEVADAELVSPLANEPVVVDGLAARSSSECYAARGAFSPLTERLERWECVAAPWWDDPEALDVPLAADGPADWRRVGDVADAEAKPLPRVTVHDVEVGQDAISFRVDEVGVPVVVKVSDFPNWRARGADGPWRIAPNLMVVVPTDSEVTVEFATSTAELSGRILTLLGLVGLGLLVWWIPGRRPGRRGGLGTMARPDAPLEADETR